MLNFCGGDSERKGRPHSTKKEMPTVRELEFDEEDYETDSDDEEEELDEDLPLVFSSIFPPSPPFCDC